MGEAPAGEGGPRRAIAVTGPTASGKTALGIEVARRLGGEIISMDSRQVYRGMDVGTAKPTPAQRAAVPHHGLDLVDPDERFSAGRFARRARRWVREIEHRGRVPILVGGTGFFLRALTHPIFAEPLLDRSRREALRDWLRQRDTESLHRWIGRLDPDTAEKLRAGGGRQRLLRALELPLLTGRSLSWWHREAPPEAPPLPVLVFVLEVDPDILDRRIDERVSEMAAAGLVHEVQRLLDSGFDESAPGMNATGYVELIPALRGSVPLEDALDQVRRNTRAYSRRQRTWFRNQLPPGAIPLDGTMPVEENAERIVREWEEHAKSFRTK